MLRLKSIICCLVLLSLAFPLGNVWAKKSKGDEGIVSGIALDVVRIEACAKKKRCVAASGPMQLDLIDLADGRVDFANQVLLPERTKELRLVLGDNNTITVDGESFPLTVPSGQRSGLKLKGHKAFGNEGGFLSGLTLDLNLQKQLVVKRGKSGSKGSGKGKRKGKSSVAYSYKLKPVIKVLSAEVMSVAWKSKKLVVEQFQGTADKYSLTIVAAKDAKDVSLQVVPELQDIVHVLPDSIGDIQEGQEIPLTIIVGFPVDVAVGKLDGAIQLKVSARNATVSLPVELIVKEWERGDLPADPGEAGKQTLLGIDSDNDGVRDDVQIAIAHLYHDPEDDNARLALNQFAASLQYAFTVFQSGDKNQLFNVFSEINPAVACITATSSNPLEDVIFVKLLMRNTEERLQAYADINETAGGRTFALNPEPESSCKR